MNKFFRSVAMLAALAAASVAHASSTFNYSYTFGSHDVVSGSFTGDASGNLVTNLSNITAFIDGAPLNGSGSLFNALYTGDWTADAGVASFDGTQNDFLFIDSHYPIDYNYSNFFYSINGVSTFVYAGGHYVGESLNVGNWKLTSAVPETGNVALMLAGLGLVGMSLRRKAAKR